MTEAKPTTVQGEATAAVMVRTLYRKNRERSAKLELGIDHSEFFPGETITGTVYLRLRKPMLQVVAVKVGLKGVERCFAGISRTDPNSLGKRTYVEKMFSMQVVSVWHRDKNNLGLPGNFRPGDYEWNFALPVPFNLPPAFAVAINDWAAVQYRVEAVVEPLVPLPQLSVVQARPLPVTMYGMNPLRWAEICYLRPKYDLAGKSGGGAGSAVRAAESSTMTRALAVEESSGNIDVSINLQRTALHLGEEVTFNIGINNHSGRDVHGIRVELLQLVRSLTKIKTDISLDKMLIGELDETVASGQRATKQVTLRVPVGDAWRGSDRRVRLYPSFKGSLFTVTHSLSIRLDVRFARDPTFDVDVRIFGELLQTSGGLDLGSDAPAAAGATAATSATTTTTTTTKFAADA